MAVSEYEEKLSEPTSKTESGVLAKLWRSILRDNGYIPALGPLVDRYLQSQEEMTKRIPSLKKKNKSTLVTNITSAEMTVKTFLDLIFNLLRVKRLDISIKLTFHNGKETIHSTSVKYGTMVTHRDIEDDLEDLKKEKSTNGN